MKLIAALFSIAGLSFGSQVDDPGIDLYHLPPSILRSNYMVRAKIESKVDTAGHIEGTPYGFRNTKINVNPERVYLDERPDARILQIEIGTGGFQKKMMVDSSYLLMLSCDTSRCRIVDWKYTRGSDILLEKASIQIGAILDKKCPKNPYSFFRTEIPDKYLELIPVSPVSFLENVAFVRKHYYWAKVWYPEPNSSGFLALRRNEKRVKQGFSNPPLYYIAEEVVKLFDQEIVDFEKRMELEPGSLLEKSWKSN